MALLTTQDRTTARVVYTAAVGEAREQFVGLSRAQIQSAIDATDQWISDNSAAFNTALPLAVRNALTAPQKARLLVAVVERRFLSGV